MDTTTLLDGTAVLEDPDLQEHQVQFHARSSEPRACHCGGLWSEPPAMNELIGRRLRLVVGAAPRRTVLTVNGRDARRCIALRGRSLGGRLQNQSRYADNSPPPPAPHRAGQGQLPRGTRLVQVGHV